MYNLYKIYVSDNRHNTQTLYYRKYNNNNNNKYIQNEIKYPTNKGNTRKIK